MAAFRRPSAAVAVVAACVASVSAARAETTFYQARVAPILDRHCVSCHGPEKRKAGLRLDSFEAVMRGAESGVMVKPGDPRGSELFRRVTLPASDEEVMPTDGKPLLSRDEIRNLELWIAGGASATKVVADFPGAPPLSRFKAAEPARAPDWRPRAAEIAALEARLQVRLVPRSQVPTDGLILRTAGSPARCDDAALQALVPVAELIVEAELARTRVTDAGLATVAGWNNLRAVDLTRTAVSSAGVARLAGLSSLEVLNLTDTAVDDAGVAPLRVLPALKRLWVHGTRVAVPADEAAK